MVCSKRRFGIHRELYPESAAGDYASGTNHTLPTNGYAKEL
jgi:histidinol dehydrogenase